MFLHLYIKTLPVYKITVFPRNEWSRVNTIYMAVHVRTVVQ